MPNETADRVVAMMPAADIAAVSNEAVRHIAAVAMTPTAADDDDAYTARDEHGMTRDERDKWLALYTAIGTMTQVAVTESPSHAEAGRRLALLKLDLRVCGEALAMCPADQWETR